jgi:hypothetical protein
MGENKALTCQNPSCKKNFTAPLKTLNMQNPTEPYFSCPHCLTKIEAEPQKIQEPPKEIELEEPQTIQVERKEKVKNNDKPTECKYHPGYLSERSSKEQIPDDCLVCKDIVDCMLRKMRE